MWMEINYQITLQRRVKIINMHLQFLSLSKAEPLRSFHLYLPRVRPSYIHAKAQQIF